MANARLVALISCLLSSPLHAEIIFCRGFVVPHWGYVTIATGYGSECIITRRVGMQRVIDICGTQSCRVTGSMEGASMSNDRYIEQVLSIQIDPNPNRFEPVRLGDPALVD